MNGEEASLQVLRVGTSIAIVFLIIYLTYDLWLRPGEGLSGAVFHWIAIFATVGFLGASFTGGFRRHWKLWNLLFSVTLISLFIMISRQTKDADSRYIAILLYPLASAAFVDWDWRWQALSGLTCLALYGLAQLFIPLTGDSIYRWFGLLAAVTLARVHLILYGCLSAASRSADRPDETGGGFSRSSDRHHGP